MTGRPCIPPPKNPSIGLVDQDELRELRLREASDVKAMRALELEIEKFSRRSALMFRLRAVFITIAIGAMLGALAVCAYAVLGGA